MNRTSTTASCCSLPTRRTTPSWMTRSSLAWSGIVISVSSSRKSVPPLAVSSRPGLSRSAPVKAPFRWPNISDSSSGSGSAAQLIGTSARLARRLCWWMNWAMTSLPVPLSPLMNTEASVAATFRASSTALRNSGRDPDQGDLVAVAVLLHQLDAEILGFARHHHRVRGAADQHLEVGGGERLGQVVPGAGPQRLDAAGDARDCRSSRRRWCPCSASSAACRISSPETWDM